MWEIGEIGASESEKSTSAELFLFDRPPSHQSVRSFVSNRRPSLHPASRNRLLTQAPPPPPFNPRPLDTPPSPLTPPTPLTPPHPLDPTPPPHPVALTRLLRPWGRLLIPLGPPSLQRLSRIDCDGANALSPPVLLESVKYAPLEPPKPSKQPARSREELVQTY